MSEKPFWEGKKSTDLYGLKVKIVCADGATLTGPLIWTPSGILAQPLMGRASMRFTNGIA